MLCSEKHTSQGVEFEVLRFLRQRSPLADWSGHSRMNEYLERTFEELASEISESFQFFDSQEGLGDCGGSQDIAAQAKYLAELLRTFKPKKSQLDMFCLYDANKPYTRNVICDSRRFQLVLYCWNPGAASKIHDHPCDFCLVVPLSGALKIERFEPGRVLVRNQVRFLLEGQGQVAFLTNNDGFFKFTNPRRYVNMISLSLLTPPYRSHTTWATPESEPELTRIGTFSIRGIRTPRLEARLSHHGRMLVELKEKATLIPAGANLKPHGKRRDIFSAAPMAGGGDGRPNAADAGGGGRAAAAFAYAGSAPASPERESISESARGVDSKTGKVTIQTRSGDVFSLGESVGKGSFGSVFQAFSKITGNFAAVKVISAPFDDPESEKHVQNIVTEITLLQSCEHPNIVRYFDAVKTSNNFYIVTEFMESRSIAHILSSFGPLEESLARNYMQQILKGLSYLHERQVVHRDVKGERAVVL